MTGSFSVHASHLQGCPMFLPLQALLCKAILKKHMTFLVEVIKRDSQSDPKSILTSLSQILNQVWVMLPMAALTYIIVFFINS